MLYIRFFLRVLYANLNSGRCVYIYIIISYDYFYYFYLLITSLLSIIFMYVYIFTISLAKYTKEVMGGKRKANKDIPVMNKYELKRVVKANKLVKEKGFE